MSNEEGEFRIVLAYKKFECINCDSQPKLVVTEKGIQVIQCAGCGRLIENEKEFHERFREIKGYSNKSKLLFETVRDPVKNRALVEKLCNQLDAIIEDAF